ncbi:hypothetical protein GCM10008012_07190 [Rhizobium anhuiense]|uniref:Uncharacterized protein n=1 Tax=Rhizobium anhuiense TaxID=1184720 RepID=A0A3S0SBQ2_9HYPH|nr:hypothetical protein EEQ99_06785 [Rhizobium anhuiense]GGD65472.1 hypothetical protein GCM10008012_07190 [Rhizobium anhuiense]
MKTGLAPTCVGFEDAAPPREPLILVRPAGASKGEAGVLTPDECKKRQASMILRGSALQAAHLSNGNLQG